VSLATVLFAFSTLIGWSYYGEKAVEYLFNTKAIKVFRLAFVLVVMVGATRELSFVWHFSDLMNGLMAIPNLIGLLLLAKIVKSESERYFQ
jgi:AGCS family alanine or glycine:cation symporter